MRRVYSIIGFAQKAGKVSSGTMAVQNSLLANRAHLMIISNDIAEKTRETLLQDCQKKNIPWLVLGDKYELGTCVGKAYRVAVTINDKNMAHTIISSVRTDGEETNSMGVVGWQK